MHFEKTPGYKIISAWLQSKKQKPFAFQKEAWEGISKNESGLINAPTGSGKTYSVFLGALIRFINENPENFRTKEKNGLQLLWVTPLRALGQDIARAMEEAIREIGLAWKVGIRNGDTSTNERVKQKRGMPEILLITPESMHLLLAQKEGIQLFKYLQVMAIDEWHDLLGTKRGVQIELAISRLLGDRKPNKISIWGISATIGNLEEAAEVLMYPLGMATVPKIIKADIQKKIEVISVIPDEVENYPWAGHLGLKMAEKVIPIIEASNSTLIFINTRGMSERWYQRILEIAPQLAGQIALHHGSIEQELRLWVEDAIRTQKLKVVVCTASLDLGVDFHPVDTVIQVGSPKGVSRFLQRAGRSGHKPGQTSRIYFLPTYSLELMEAAALKKAIETGTIESREPLSLCFDVLIQYCCTLAVGDGFHPDQLFEEVKSTWCFQDLSKKEWEDVLLHIYQGGKALSQYDDYHKIEIENGLYKIKKRRLAMQHRLQIGTIVSEAMLKVKFMTGGYLGMIEEYFISRLKTGDVFTLAGRNLELVIIKDMTVMVRKSNAKKSIVPSWMGGRMSLTANLGHILRHTFQNALNNESTEELKNLQHLLHIQHEVSHIPAENELLIEYLSSKEGFHLLVYPFEGRQVHEAMSALLAYRISRQFPITFSIAMNDYGFELNSDTEIQVEKLDFKALLSTENLLSDIQHSVNNTEMARRKFRDIAVIGGLIYQGKPGEQMKARHLQSNSGLLFKVFTDYEPDNILLRQAYKEVLEQQMEEVRMRTALERIQKSTVVLKKPDQFSPLSFPIIVDGLNRNNLSSEKMEERIKKMQEKLLQ